VAEHEPDENDVAAQIRALDVEQYVVATASTLASLAYAKLEAKELPQAKLAIDALAALVPLVGDVLRRDLQAALTSLQVAYAGSATG